MQLSLFFEKVKGLLQLSLGKKVTPKSLYILSNMDVYAAKLTLLSNINKLAHEAVPGRSLYVASKHALLGIWILYTHKSF